MASEPSGEREPRRRVEEVQGTSIDGELDLLADRHACPWAEPADERRGLRTRARFVASHDAVVADVLGELPHLLGHGLSRIGRAVDHDLGTERLAELDACN